jgi:hypothetical protein
MTTPSPDFKWYSGESKRLGLASFRCPFASLHGCPKYYESRALLGKAGSTSLEPELAKQLEAKWKGHPLAPNEMEQMPMLTGDGSRTTGYANFCPEVLYERFGLFVTSLFHFHDELDQAARHQSLKEKGAADGDPLWDWSGVRAQHYSECPVYAPLSHDWPKHARTVMAAPAVRFDVFISHASEDKEEFVRPLAAALAAMGLRVWFDEWTLTLGDGLRKRIDEGLVASDFGVVVLSRHFFAKNWTQAELEGLFAKEMEGRKVILPIWHNITEKDLLQHSPMLAGKLAAPTNEGVESVARKIYAAVRPQLPPPSVVPIMPPTVTATVREIVVEADHVKAVADRFVQIFKDHGVARSQIPRFIPEVSLDKLCSWDVLVSVLTPEVLDKTAELFGLRRMWFDGIGDQIYDHHDCYKQPDVFFQDLLNLKNPGHFPVSAIIDCKRLDMNNKSEEQNVVLVLADELAYLEEEQICRYTIYSDDFHWDYWKCRHQLKSMARVYYYATGRIFPIFSVSNADLQAVESGCRVPRKILKGRYDHDRYLEEYAVFPGEGTGAPEMEEAPKVQEYIRDENLEEWGKRLKAAWEKSGRKRVQ